MVGVMSDSLPLRSAIGAAPPLGVQVASGRQEGGNPPAAVTKFPLR